MEKAHKKEIEKILGLMQCPKDFKCYRSGFKALCKAKDVGMDAYLRCLEENPHNCLFLLPFPRTHYCECPLRVFVAKKLKK